MSWNTILYLELIQRNTKIEDKINCSIVCVKILYMKSLCISKQKLHVATIKQMQHDSSQKLKHVYFYLFLLVTYARLKFIR